MLLPFQGRGYSSTGVKPCKDCPIWKSTTPSSCGSRTRPHTQVPNESTRILPSSVVPFVVSLVVRSTTPHKELACLFISRSFFFSSLSKYKNLCFVLQAIVIRFLHLRPIDCTVHSLSNMQTTFALAALAAVAYAAPQGVTGDITPTAPAPPGCTGSYNGQFEITIINGTTAKRDLSKVCCHGSFLLSIC